MKKIIFVLNPGSYSSETEFAAHLPHVKCEDQLFDKLSEVLQFPDYFGHNWDAVYDCLRDFSWITQKGIVLMHDEIPALNETSLKIYFEVLNDAVNNWKEEEEHYLKIVLPEGSQSLIQNILPI